MVPISQVKAHPGPRGPGHAPGPWRQVQGERPRTARTSDRRAAALLAELDQVGARERRRREMELEMDLDRSPDDGKRNRRTSARVPAGVVAGAGHGDRVSRHQEGNPDRIDPIAEFLKNDPDDQWGEP